ncbi:MAG TPA: RDD family protein [Ilumatobacteraceae bacterium]
MFPAGNEVAQPAVPAGLILAPIVRRVGGLIIDQVLVALPVVLVVVALGFTPNDTVTSKSLLMFNIGLTSVGFVYETTMIALLGRTVGKIALGTRVVRLVDGGRPDWYEAGMRALVPLSLGAIPRVGVVLGVLVYSLAMWNPLRQGLHDKAAGTLVVRNAAPL